MMEVCSETFRGDRPWAIRLDLLHGVKGRAAKPKDDFASRDERAASGPTNDEADHAALLSGSASSNVSHEIILPADIAASLR